MKCIFLVFAVGAMLFSSQAALASGECDKYSTRYDNTYCMCKLFIESDNELNTVYKDLRKIIPESARNQLTSVQREWMRHRDEACQPQPGTIAVDCNYKLNRERAKYLRDRLNECKTGACQNDKIGQRSW